MRMEIVLEFVAKDMDWDAEGDLYDLLAEEFCKKHSIPQKVISDFFEDKGYVLNFALDDPLIDNAISFLESRLPEKCGPVYEKLAFGDLHQSERDKYEYVVKPSIGDDASDAEKTDHRHSKVTCPACGNNYQDHDFIPRIISQRIPKKYIFMTMANSLKFVCRPRFIDLYEKAGLTGFSFEELENVKSRGEQIYRAIIQMHEWQNREGVCDTCGMKTNVRCAAYFNLEEKWKYDFQAIRYFDGHDIVLSRKAVAFLDEHTELGVQFKYCAAPIMPGYMIDKIYPENRLFAHGECPTRVRRR